MKVLLINSSSHEKGCTYTALSEIAKVLNDENIETEIVWLGAGAVRDCIACGGCAKLDNACVFGDDKVNEIIKKAQDCDGFVFGSPVYYAHPSGRLLSALDRMFYAGGAAFKQKPGMAVASARRAGTTATIDVINKHFAFNQMPIISSTYWTMVHGSKAEDVLEDKEGLQTMRNGAKNMAWILKAIEAGKESGIMPPVADKSEKTNFIR